MTTDDWSLEYLTLGAELMISTSIECDDEEACQRLVEEYVRVLGRFSGELFEDVQSSLKEMIDGTSDEKQLRDYLALLENKNEKVVETIAKTIIIIGRDTGNSNMIRDVVSAYSGMKDLLETAACAPTIALKTGQLVYDRTLVDLKVGVYTSLCRRLVHKDSVLAEIGDSMKSLAHLDFLIFEKIFQEHIDFLEQQSAEVIVPLAATLSNLEEKYHPRITALSTQEKLDLARAYSIAKENINDDTGLNYLTEFYSGVKGMLDTRPDDLGRWAASICSDFRKK